MRKIARALLIISAVGLVLNLLWENAQAPLYEGYAGFIQHLSICSVASLGDVAIIIFLYVLFALVFKDMLWFMNLRWKSIVSLMVIGTIIGIGIEKWALITGRWSYTEGMPIISFFNVGLTPVLQMTILPILTFRLSSKYKKITI